mmetsp:Transcript_33630/g.81363  ORF Transcript_33630/g.81363 Transcript_33630/m.81363 type:complete len:120 (-) Transcript_33630:94-453(-)
MIRSRAFVRSETAARTEPGVVALVEQWISPGRSRKSRAEDSAGVAWLLLAWGNTHLFGQCRRLMPAVGSPRCVSRMATQRWVVFFWFWCCSCVRGWSEIDPASRLGLRLVGDPQADDQN